ncbi:MAG: lysophospholipid acyltransferase family protein [Gemmatimonadota bacterium]
MSRPVLRFTASRGGPLVARTIEALARTWDIRIDGEQHLEKARSGGGILFCFWHGRMLELAPVHARRRIGVLVSGHPDGIMAARIVEPLGYVPILGSQRRNPVAGFRAMLRYAREGRDLALAPDAHSDAHRVLPGAVALSRRTGHALLPVAAAARPRRRVESWDRFEIPWPRALVRIRYGPPLWIDATTDARAARAASRDLEGALQALHLRVEDELDGLVAEPAGAPVTVP